MWTFSEHLSYFPVTIETQLLASERKPFKGAIAIMAVVMVANVCEAPTSQTTYSISVVSWFIMRKMAQEVVQGHTVPGGGRSSGEQAQLRDTVTRFC